MSKLNGGFWAFVGAAVPVAIAAIISLNTVSVSIARLEEQFKALYVTVQEIKLELRAKNHGLYKSIVDGN